jgi:hypothetical protein
MNALSLLQGVKGIRMLALSLAEKEIMKQEVQQA